MSLFSPIQRPHGGQRSLTKLRIAVTLLELVVVVAIVGILAGIAVAAYRNHSRNADTQQQRVNASLLSNAVDQAKSMADANGVTIDWGSAAADPMTVTRANEIVAAINTAMAACTRTQTLAPILFESGYTLPASAAFPTGWGEPSLGTLDPVP